MPPADPDLMFLLASASQALRVRHVVGLAEVGISPREHCVLSNARCGELTQKQIGDRCGVDKTTMVVTLDQLEGAGLVRRRLSPTDRRARLVSVTPDGEKVLRRAQQIAGRIQEEVLGGLPDGERQVLFAALTRLAAAPSSVTTTPGSGGGGQVT